MFTGIVETVAEIQAVADKGGDKALAIRVDGLDLSGVKLGDSIAVNGVCLTVTHLDNSGFHADISRETLSLSSLASVKAGAPVNIERALLASGRFDGHIVSGHIDGTGTITERYDDARSIRLNVSVPEPLRRYTAHKGSICIDGVSLTINALSSEGVELNIIPHSAAQTIIAGYRPGTVVNLEVDIIARYLERLLTGSGAKPDGISEAFLAEHGFLRGRG
ncbi:MAG TPA: riboflavin synthase [Spongiibacteraceae bacterium]|nr:riboflavin synthase [Spongiibacteraceae bacterium]HCS27018.1 riboflavin synthase [Spongiibacteraceae bacterium]